MSKVLSISVSFLLPAPVFHGRRDGNEPEWPPSPLRLFQALVDAAASRRSNSRRLPEQVRPALEWLQQLQPAEIVAPPHRIGTPYRIAVPNNDWDSPARAWAAGREPVKPHRPIDLKTMKSLQPVRLNCANYTASTLHYLYSLSDEGCPYLQVLQSVARSITHLGWGIDMAVGNASILTAEQAAQLPGIRWRPSSTGTPLRTPKPGTLDDLCRKHKDSLGRVMMNGFRPVPPLRVYDLVSYRSQDVVSDRPYCVFELRNLDGTRFRYPHRLLIHIAGMVRHLAIRATASRALLEKLFPHQDQDKDPFRDGSPPPGIEDTDHWVETYIAGHIENGSQGHRQLSYIPLPSIGRDFTDPSVRRVMIVAPLGDDAWLDHLARILAGKRLEPLTGNEFRDGDPPLLVPVRRDPVAHYYTQASNAWASVTPVILPGHDDHKPEKTRKLIEKALAQSGIEHPCEFEWSAFSRFAKSYSAHKYGGYIRPDHLKTQTAVHLTLRFKNGLKVPGPLTIGAGRHCGFGLMARIDE